MRLDFHGLVFDTPGLTAYLWSPWRASALEHRLFDVIAQIAGVKPENAPDERRLHIDDPKAWKQAALALSRVLKGWQEEADPSEKRSWRWMLEGDCDDYGYDHSGEALTMWIFLRAAIDRGGPGEPDKGEDIDFNGFGLRIWGNRNGK